LLHGVALVMECQRPRDMFTLLSHSKHSIKLDSNRLRPLERFAVERKPHLIVAVNLVWGRVRIKHSLDLLEQIVQVVLSWCHNLKYQSAAGGLT